MEKIITLFQVLLNHIKFEFLQTMLKLRYDLPSRAKRSAETQMLTYFHLNRKNWILCCIETDLFFFFFFLFLIEQIEQAKQDLSRKDSELLAFRTKLETLTNQFSDSKQHVDVLKESLAAKEQRAAILQTEVQALLVQYFVLYTLQPTNKC